MSIAAIVSYKLRRDGEAEANDRLWFKLAKEDKGWKIMGGKIFADQDHDRETS